MKIFIIIVLIVGAIILFILDLNLFEILSLLLLFVITLFLYWIGENLRKLTTTGHEIKKILDEK